MAIFQYPFAINGDRNTALPNAASLTGLVSFQEGFTPIYETLPSLGGQFIQRRDFNEIVYRICAGVNTLDAQGNKILENSSTAIGEFKLGQIFYYVANDNIYLLIDKTGVTKESTIIDLIDAGRVKNITPLGQGQSWQRFDDSREIGTIYTNTTGRAIAVFAYIQMSGTIGGTAGVGLYVYQGDFTGNCSYAPLYNASSSYGCVAGVIPAGAQYRVASFVTTASVTFWRELR